MRRSERPTLRGCPKATGWLKLHQWQHRWDWNGNDRRVLPFVDSPYGIARSGWRCFHCGRFEWDESDRLYALGIAEAWGLICLPTALEEPA